MLLDKWEISVLYLILSRLNVSLGEDIVLSHNIISKIYINIARLRRKHIEWEETQDSIKKKYESDLNYLFLLNKEDKTDEEKAELDEIINNLNILISDECAKIADIKEDIDLELFTEKEFEDIIRVNIGNEFYLSPQIYGSNTFVFEKLQDYLVEK